MGARSVYFNEEMESILTGFKSANPDFNLTDFVKNAMKGDDTMLTEEQIEMKLKGLEYDRAQIDLEIDHLKRVIPLAKKNEEKLDEEKEKKIANALDVIIRHRESIKLENFASVHAKLTGMTSTELIKLADEKSEKDEEEKKAKEEAYRLAQEELNESPSI